MKKAILMSLIVSLSLNALTLKESVKEVIEEMVTHLRENLLTEIETTTILPEELKAFFRINQPFLQEGNFITSFSGIAFEGLPV